MGLFDLFKGGSKGKGDKSASAVAKYAETAAAKRAQTYERQEAIAKLAELGTVEAAAALLKRFTFSIDPSITDQEEKEAAFRGILAVGADALPAVRTFVTKAESLSWPMRIAKELLTEDEYVLELLKWLERWDTEYQKFIDPKLQILTALEDHKHPSIREAVEKFLEDVNEPARFHAVATLFAQEDTAAAPALVKALAAEESFRIKNKIVDGFALRTWMVPAALIAMVREALPGGVQVDEAGKLRRA